ncbi:MAG: hypothetical protein QOD41_2054 [Cryptosporangiaceae bacterium]|nr:hypothetical protein [Cryptosporangiaceae bacterium]
MSPAATRPTSTRPETTRPAPVRPGSGRPVRRIALALAAVALPILGVGPRAAVAVPGAVTYSAPGLRCSVTDPRLREISGMVTSADGLYVLNDKAPAAIFGLDWNCQVRKVIDLGLRVYDTEDLGRSPDGTLWVGDIGGNVYRRPSVLLDKRTPDGTVSTVQLDYPDGPHDAEALMISQLGDAVIVTKQRDGHSGIYTVPLLAGVPRHELRFAGSLDLRAMRPSSKASVLVTGGAVAAGGRHVVIRTYSDAYEWDAPDGNIVAAMLAGPPRTIPLAPTRQGESITYSIDGRYLLTSTEKLPAPLHAVTITRPVAPPAR